MAVPAVRVQPCMAGAGQTEARIDLPPPASTRWLVLGDTKHYPFNSPVISKKITITVK
jgi:hypothetical protein